jgi:hypothetical protein
VRETSLRDGDGLGNQACVAVELAPLAGQTPAGPGGDIAGETAPHKSRRNNTMGGEPPGVSNIVKVCKDIFAKFEGDNWAESASGNITSQALGACLSECQFKRCAAQQPLRLRATVLLRGHLLKVYWICRRRGGDCSSGGGGGGRDMKSATTFFKPGRYSNCTLNSEINAKWRCCLGEIQPAR